jgi:uncharacterized membrane protein
MKIDIPTIKGGFMETLTRAENDVVKNAINSKELFKSNILNQSITILIAVICLISPIVFLISNSNSLDHIFKTVGMYLAMMELLGIIIFFFSTHLNRINYHNRKTASLNSAIRKIITNTNFILE